MAGKSGVRPQKRLPPPHAKGAVRPESRNGCAAQNNLPLLT
jgi:hypothetical protein